MKKQLETARKEIRRLQTENDNQRKQNEELKKQNERIPELEKRIRELEEALKAQADTKPQKSLISSSITILHEIIPAIRTKQKNNATPKKPRNESAPMPVVFPPH